MTDMRLKPEQTRLIVGRLRARLGADSQVWLFGSRVDDDRRGGDIDLLVECDTPPPRLDVAMVRQAIEDELQIPVDLLVKQRGKVPTAFQSIAMANAVALDLATV